MKLKERRVRRGNGMLNTGEWIMKDAKRFCLTVLSAVLAVSVHAAAVVEKPAVLPEAMITATVSDLHGFIDGVGSVAVNVMPMCSGAYIKNMAGMQIGDPGLNGIAPGKGLAVVVLDPATIFGVMEISEAQLGTYTNLLSSVNMSCKPVDGLLVVAKTAEQAERGAAMAKAVQEKLLSRRSPAVRLVAQPAGLIQASQPQIQGMLQMMPMLMGQGMMQVPGTTANSMQSIMKILEGELRLALSIASQCDQFEVALKPAGGSLRIDKTIVPQAGSRLAGLVSAPKVNEPNAKIRAGYFDGAMIAFDACMANTDAWMEFALAEAGELEKAMHLGEGDVRAIIEQVGKFWQGLGGSFAEAVDLSASGMSVGYLIEVKDEAAAMAMLRQMPTDMAPLLKLYEGMGIQMTMAFKEKVRSYKGTDIHRLAMTMNMKDQPEEVEEQLEAMGMTNLVYEIAVVDGIMIYTMGGMKMDTAIDRLTDASFTPARLKARAVYPAGGSWYGDIDVARYLSFVAAFMPAEAGAIQPMVSMLQGTEPMTTAAFREDGCVMFSLNIPGDLIARIGQAVMMQQMQQMNSGSMPAAMP